MKYVILIAVILIAVYLFYKESFVHGLATPAFVPNLYSTPRPGPNNTPARLPTSA